MGISQEVYTVYGWKCDPENNKVKDWLEEVDYEYPEGFIYDDMGVSTLYLE